MGSSPSPEGLVLPSVEVDTLDVPELMAVKRVVKAFETPQLDASHIKSSQSPELIIEPDLGIASRNFIDLTLDSDNEGVLEVQLVEHTPTSTAVKGEPAESTNVLSDPEALTVNPIEPSSETLEIDSAALSAEARVPDTGEAGEDLGSAPVATFQMQTITPEDIQQRFAANRAYNADHLEGQLLAGMAAFHASLNVNADPAILDDRAEVATSSTQTGDNMDHLNILQLRAPTMEEMTAGLNSETEENEAAAKFRQMKRAHLRKLAKGQVTDAEDIVFRRAEQTEQTRQKRLERKRAYVAAENEPEAPPAGDEERMFFSEHELEVQQEPPAKKQKARANHIPQAAFDESVRIGYEANGARPPKRRSKAGKAATRTEKRSAKEKSTNSAKGKRMEKSDTRKRAGPDMTNLNLLNADIVADAQANFGQAAQPEFTSKRKNDAMKQLIASIPEDDMKSAKCDNKALLNASKAFPRCFVTADGSNGWRMKGLNTRLYHYQLLGVAWMYGRESNDKHPHGGIQADGMGYGKTLQIISLILSNQASPTSRNRTTLIVSPASLVSQWLNQIKQHVEPGQLGTVMVHRSGNRVLTDNDLRTLTSCGVVITTYHEILNSFPHCRAPDHLCTEDAKQAWWADYYEKNRGSLHRIFWRRIVIDEAHAFKNYQSRTAVAVLALAGKYRWAVSGTPVHNSLEEFYPYFRFIKVSNTGSFETFRKNFATGKGKSLQRLHAMLRLIMIRRTGQDKLFNRPLLSLPKLGYKTITVEFNETERIIYHTLKARFVARINTWISTGDIQKKHQSVWTMFLRLRQLCGHVLLVQQVLKDMLEREDIEKLWEWTAREQEPAHCEASMATMKALKAILSGNDTAETPGEGTNVSESQTGGDFGSSFKFRKYLTNLRESGKWDEAIERSDCAKCATTPPEQPFLTSPCMHLYCRECIAMLLHEAAENGQDRGVCVACNTVFDGAKPCQGYDQAGFSANAVENASETRRATSATPSKDADWLLMGGVVLPSAKTVATKMQILKWWDDCKGDQPRPKVIVFTQFLGMIKILSRVCQTEGWDYCLYHGGMGWDARDKSLTEFTKDGEKNILLASLKAGGLGLNLVMANKVIIIDPWWNSSVEDQAFSRVYRIGQEKDVEIVRFVVNKAIDTDLMLKKQVLKDAEIDRAMGEKNKPGKLSIEELLRLFGPVRGDEEGNLLIDPSAEPDEFVVVEDEGANTDHSDDEAPTAIPPTPF